MALKTKDSLGWVGIGFDQTMKNVYYIVLLKDINNLPTVSECWSTGFKMPTPFA